SKERYRNDVKQKQKSNSKLDNNDGTAKPEGDTKREREITNLQNGIDRRKHMQKPSKRPGFLRRASGPYTIETKQEEFHRWKQNQIRVD
ncbi:MAG: hypothetical protein Q9164_007272, partial [Protoblastenia rupestris]